MPEIGTIPAVRDLRHRWKPHKERLAALGGEQPTWVRFHRACSWMARVESMREGEDHNLGLVSLWVAFNALYGQWDCQRREPRPDRESWRLFIDRILKLDLDGHVAAMLQEHKRLVISLLDDEYVSAYFWQEPTAERGKKGPKIGVQCAKLVHRAALDADSRRDSGPRLRHALPARPRRGHLRRQAEPHVVEALRHHDAAAAPDLAAGLDRPRGRSGLGADVLSADRHVAGIDIER
jgi:hypothetical protein